MTAQSTHRYHVWGTIYIPVHTRNYIHPSEYRYVIHGTMTDSSIQIWRKKNYDSLVNTDRLYTELWRLSQYRKDVNRTMTA